jgi:hypothetical protein
MAGLVYIYLFNQLACYQEMLDQMVDVDLVVNFKSKDETIINKQIRGEVETCSHCGRPFSMSQPESSRNNPCLATRTRHAQVQSHAVVGLEGRRLEKVHFQHEQVCIGNFSCTCLL